MLSQILSNPQPQFPSPIGELHFSIEKGEFACWWTHCFRPLSGSYISQFTECHGSKSGMAVSVPYRGATFLNGEPMFTLTGQDRFPSPIGELHFSIEVNNEKTWRAAVSVPYRGATFLNGTKRPTVDSFTKEQFPSPIGELHFSIKNNRAAH